MERKISYSGDKVIDEVSLNTNEIALIREKLIERVEKGYERLIICKQNGEFCQTPAEIRERLYEMTLEEFFKEIALTKLLEGYNLEYLGLTEIQKPQLIFSMQKAT